MAAASFNLLEHVGIRLTEPEARDLLSAAGARLEGERVTIPASLVREMIDSAPASISLYTRDGELAMGLGGMSACFGAHTDAPDVLDPFTDERRPCTEADIGRHAVLIDALPSIRFATASGMVADRPQAVADRAALAQCLIHSRKPVLAMPLTPEAVIDSREMAALAVGGNEALRDRPTLVVYAEPVSPLSHPDGAIRKLLTCAEHEIPLVYTPYAAMGATAPMSPTGITAQLCAESLSGLVVHQLKHPGAPFVFGGMAYDGWESGFSESFLDDVLSIMRANGRYPFDIMNFHYYPLFATKWEALDPGIDIIAKTNYIRNKMSEYGADKPLICTETSMWSNCIDENVEVLCGSDEKQSRYVPQVYARSRAAGLEFSIWYMLYDVDEVWAWDYGLLDANLNPKLSHQAYLTLGRHLLGTDYSRTLSLSETGSNEIEAYEFLERNTTERVVVAWSNDGVDYQMRLRGASLVRVGKYGDKVTIYDGDDGQADGYVVVTIGPSPVYLRLDK